MDESWKMRLGSNLPRRKSTEETRTTLRPEDFNDVFGGPPKTILSRKKSVPDFSFSYQDVYQSPEYDFSSKNGQSVPVFGMQGGGGGRRKGVYKRNDHGFYNDIFGSDEDGRSSKGYSKSKSNSSSVLSSEDLSPLRNSTVEDVFFSSFSTKLRPINIPSQMSSSFISVPEQRSVQGNSDIPPWSQPPSIKSRFLEKDLINKNYKTSSPIKFFKSSSPNTISIEPISYQSIKASIDDIEIDSPSSVVSSLCNRNLDINSIFHGKALQEEEETMSSYIIEISREKSKGTMDESVVALDEAIAWAKEKFHKSLEVRSSDAMGGSQRQNVSPSATEPSAEREGRSIMHGHCNQQQDGDGRARFLLVNEKLRSWMTEERQQSEKM
ncbi:hypothetical protein IFM89_017655 [Coptis chinensis]|uniref:Uncharacterized protein n=1 Tax=Coptis chinensis TaxID=261450 RepID=A0A835GWR4_9MAGN|nr:hypothetical protein IFM89_017655 [Coptis chinensis]